MVSNMESRSFAKEGSVSVSKELESRPNAGSIYIIEVSPLTFSEKVPPSLLSSDSKNPR